MYDIHVSTVRYQWLSPLLGKTLQSEYGNVPLKLLEMNTDIHFGRFAMKREGDHWSILVSCDQLFDTIDEEEFVLAVDYVAREADAFEKEYLGVDHY